MVTTGPKTKEFERRIAEYCDVNKAVCLNSQSACAEMALRILGIGEGDEVIVPAYTYTATASVVCHVGAKLVLVDVQKDSLKWITISWKLQLQKRLRLSYRSIWAEFRAIMTEYLKLWRERKVFSIRRMIIQRVMGRISVNADAAHAFGQSGMGKKWVALLTFHHLVSML